MSRLVHQVKGRLSLQVRRRSVALLDGGYASLHRGRSLEVDDLREYIPGDDVRDIAWKASARHGSMLVTRRIAERHVSMVLVVPTGRGFAAQSAAGEVKAQVAATAAGVLGWVAIRHGDEVRLVSGSPGAVRASRSLSSEGHLEHLLQHIISASRAEAPNADLPGLLRHVARTVTGRKVVVVIADDGVRAEAVADALRVIRQRHEVIWVEIADVDPTTAGPVREVARGRALPHLVVASPDLRRAYQAAETARREALATLMRRQDIAVMRVESSDEVVTAVVRLLEKRRRGR